MKYLVTLLLLVVSLGAGYPQHVVYPQQTVIKRHAVEFDANTYLGLNGYYEVIDKERAEYEKLLASEKISGDDLKTLLEVIKFLRDELAARRANKPDAGTPNPPQNPQPPVDTPEPPKVDDLDKQVYDIFKKNCASCHTESKASGGLKLVSPNGLYNLSHLQRDNVYFRTAGIGLDHFNKDLMPVGGQPLSDTDVNIIYLWKTKKMLEELKAAK